jgi:hypothetical protein
MRDGRLEMLETDFRQMMIEQRQRSLARVTRPTREAGDRLRSTGESVVLRLCGVSDDPQLDELASFDGTQIVPGRYVVAEVDGRIAAAMPLAGGDVVSDPFRRTAHLLPLLRMRAEQLTSPARTRSWFGAFRWSPVRH